MNRGRLYLLLQAAVCIALVALLAGSAITIYEEGSARKAEQPMESIYTPQAVAEKLLPIAPLFWIGVGLSIAGLLLGVKDENAEKPKGMAAASESADPPKHAAGLQMILIAAAVLLILAGALNGSALDVLYKAITICTECIGLG